MFVFISLDLMVFRCTKIGFFCQSSFRQAGCTDFCSLAGVQTVENRDFCLLEGVQTVENRDFCLLEGVQTIENYDFCSLAPVQTSKIGFSGRPQCGGRMERDRAACRKKRGACRRPCKASSGTLPVSVETASGVSVRLPPRRVSEESSCPGGGHRRR